MKIIDFQRKGNVVRFLLGDDDNEDYWGDDWDDRPYEHNAGGVYPEHIKGYNDVVFPFSAELYEPRDGEQNSSWSMQDMKARKVPCLAVVFHPQGWRFDSFAEALASELPVTRYYLGDRMDGCRLEEGKRI